MRLCYFCKIQISAELALTTFHFKTCTHTQEPYREGLTCLGPRVKKSKHSTSFALLTCPLSDTNTTQSHHTTLYHT